MHSFFLCPMLVALSNIVGVAHNFKILCTVVVLVVICVVNIHVLWQFAPQCFFFLVTGSISRCVLTSSVINDSHLLATTLRLIGVRAVCLNCHAWLSYELSDSQMHLQVSSKQTLRYIECSHLRQLAILWFPVRVVSCTRLL